MIQHTFHEWKSNRFVKPNFCVNLKHIFNEPPDFYGYKLPTELLPNRYKSFQTKKPPPESVDSNGG
jgi:hypothetical protein